MGIYGKRSLQKPRMTSTPSSVPLNYLRLKERIARSQHRNTHAHLLSQASRIRPIYVKKKRSMARARSSNNNGSSGRHTNKSTSRISKSSYSSNNHHRYLSNHNGLLNSHPINNNNNIGVRAYSTTFVSLDRNLYNNIQGDKNSAASSSSTPFLVSIEDAPTSVGVVVDGFQDSQGHGSPRIEFGSRETTALSASSLSGGGGGDNQEAQEMMLLKREAYRELASQTQRFDELFIAKMIYWESLGLEEKSRWLEGSQAVEEEEMEDEEGEFEDDLEDEEERSQHNNYFHRPATTTRTHRRVRREKRDEMDDLVTALECRATVKDYSALLAFEKQQALQHGPNHPVHGLLPQDQDVLW
ncbi:hypothetical protein CPC16_008840 [Podila verticillata]|nr:hypothetical protein CPC16_008840 [Podila verticillata]